MITCSYAAGTPEAVAWWQGFNTIGEDPLYIAAAHLGEPPYLKHWAEGVAARKKLEQDSEPQKSR